jgi:hypothetical protein
MVQATVTESLEGTAAFTPDGTPAYVFIEARPGALSASVPVAPAASPKAIAELRARLRGDANS